MLSQIGQFLSILIAKKDVDPDAHVRMFNSIIKANAETSKEYVINMFSYTLRDTASDQCHNYMSKFLTYIFLKFIQAFGNRHHNTQNDEQIYMELKNMKHEETKRVEVYYERI